MLISQKYPKEIATQGIKKASLIPLEVLRSEKGCNARLFPLTRKTFDNLQHGLTTKDTH